MGKESVGGKVDRVGLGFTNYYNLIEKNVFLSFADLLFFDLFTRPLSPVVVVEGGLTKYE